MFSASGNRVATIRDKNQCFVKPVVFMKNVSRLHPTSVGIHSDSEVFGFTVEGLTQHTDLWYFHACKTLESAAYHRLNIMRENRANQIFHYFVRLKHAVCRIEGKICSWFI